MEELRFRIQLGVDCLVRWVLFVGVSTGFYVVIMSVAVLQSTIQMGGITGEEIWDELVS